MEFVILICNWQVAIGNLKFWICNLQFTICNLKLEIFYWQLVNPHFLGLAQKILAYWESAHICKDPLQTLTAILEPHFGFLDLQSVLHCRQQAIAPGVAIVAMLVFDMPITRGGFYLGLLIFGWTWLYILWVIFRQQITINMLIYITSIKLLGPQATHNNIQELFPFPPLISLNINKENDVRCRYIW